MLDFRREYFGSTFGGAVSEADLGGKASSNLTPSVFGIKAEATSLTREAIKLA